MKTIYKKLLFLLLILPFSALAQSTLTGTVTEQTSGQPLPGVNVVVQGTQNGVATDFDGKFQLTNVNKGDVIVFSYVGFKDATVVFQSQSTVNIALEEDANQLSEVVVQVGYGSVRKKDLTGSTTTVTTKDFNKGATVTTENLLNGRVAGVTINTSGSPGSGSQIRIRGGGSLFASNDPLIVLDGLPLENKEGKAITGSTSLLAAINPSTIESITVLKDASATAIYGSRAANGVIIITTKKGGKELSVDYNFLYGSGSVVETIDVFGADRFRELVAIYKPNDVGLLGDSDTNWQDEIYRRTDYVDNNLTLRGNLFKVIPTRLTIGNTYQEGLRLTNTFNRNSINVAMNPSFLKDHLKFRVNASYSAERNRFAEDVTRTAVRFDPTQPVRDPESPYQGFFEYYNTVGNTFPVMNALRNPVAQLLQTDDRGKNGRFFGNFELDYKFHFFPELRAVVNVGFDESNGERRKFQLPGVVASSGNNGNIPYGTKEYTEETRRNKLLDAYLVYNKAANDFNVEITGGYSYQKFEVEKFETGNIFDPGLASSFPETSTDTDVILIGFFGRTNLSYKDKYLLTLSYRRDGTTRFAEDYRWSNFPAAAFAWKIREDFFKDSKTVSDFKLRLGYGITGQQDIPPTNEYLSRITTGDGVSQYIFGVDPTPVAFPQPLNPQLKWEESTTYNVGFDLGFFNNRLTASIDGFYKLTEDLIVNAAVPDGSNFSNREWQNVGSFTTKGVELGINAQVFKSDKFNWDINFNATKYERRIQDLIYDNIVLGDNVAGTGTLPQILKEGYTPYSFYVYKQLYDTSGNPIEGAYADLNGDNVINGDDKYIYKNPDPDFVLGFASNMNYGNIDFSFNLRASIGNRVLNGVDAAHAQTNLFKLDDALNNVPTSVLETGFSTTSNVVLSDIYIEDASFLRMDNITLGYTFPKWLEGKASLRFSAGVQNAFLITKYGGLDPEVTNNGLDKTVYPRQRSILFGVNVKF